MSDDYSKKSDKELEEEIDDFFSKFDSVSEVEDRFDEITSGLEREPWENTLVPQERNDPENTSGETLPAASNRLSRLQSERENKKKRSRRSAAKNQKEKGDTEGVSEDDGKFSLKESFITVWAIVCAWFSGLMTKFHIINAPETADPGETGVTMAGKRKRKKHYKVNKKKLFKFIVSIGAAFCIIMGIMVGIIIATTPSINPDNIYSRLSENSIMYDDEGQIVDSIYKGVNGMRTNVAFDDMPKNLVNAFVSIEDKTFWSHHGFNFIRIFGAIFESITKGEPISGTSTITQQLARNLYLTDTMSQRTLTRKVKEAWYTIQLESRLSKKQIVEAYLNTINLGNRSNGVQAAAQAYFSKDISELTLPECVLLATLPKSPNSYAPVKGDSNENLTALDLDTLDIISRTDDWTTWYNDRAVSSGRFQLVLNLMLDQEKITKSQHDEALAYKIRDSIKPGDAVTDNDISSYLADYTIRQVISDLMQQDNMTEDEAKNRLYNGGLRIYSTMNLKMQQAAENVFNDSKNFPSVTGLKKDKKTGNILDKSGRIMLYDKANYIDADGNFILSADEFKKNSDGSVTILKGKRLNIYTVKSGGKTDYNLEFKNMYEKDEGAFYIRNGGIIQVPVEYKSRDSEGNLVLSAQFFKDKPEFFRESGTSLVVSSTHYMLHVKVRQPQAAMVIMDQKTGAIKAMIGGRNTDGRQILNRAEKPRQPGSSIKPMGVYAPALQGGANGDSSWTAASIIDDSPLVIQGKQWPKNWYSGYRGLYTLRQSVEQSVNVNAVKVFQDIGVDKSVKSLKDFGVTTIVESGDVNDMNAAALALGGMTKGISPLEMCAGYATIANDGIYTSPVSYTKVTNKNGDIILERTPETHRVLDEGAAFIMRDILRSTVTNGLAKAANIGTHPTAGKTGTTTDQYDAWFVGFTPLYTASLWIGNDVNIELSQGSSAATKVWSKVMKQIHKDLPKASFGSPPANVVSVAIDTKSGKLPSNLSSLDPRGTVKNEFFIKNTVPTEKDDMHIEVEVCSETGLRATPWCPNKVTKVGIDGSKRASANVGDAEYNVPTYYCNQHNLDVGTYPIKEGAAVDPNFTWVPPENEGPDQSDPNGSGTITPGGTNGNGSENGNGSGSGNGSGQSTPPPDSSGANTDIPEWLDTNQN